MKSFLNHKLHPGNLDISSKTASERVTYVLLLVMFLIGCAPFQIATSGQVTTIPTAADAPDRFSRVRFFNTRQITPASEGIPDYSGERGVLSAGVCEVSPGRNNNRSSGTRLKAVTHLPVEQLLRQILDTQTRNIVIYVHGFHESFAKSCERASILQNRLNLEDKLILFSWPSQDRYLAYTQDVGNIDWTSTYLSRLVSRLIQHKSQQQLILMSHSLGARALIETVKILPSSAQPAISQMILMAPDLDSDLFINQQPMINKHVKQTTLYVSETDRALQLSRVIHGEVRLGTASDGLALADNIKMIDISQSGFSGITGHFYHLYNPAVIEDLNSLFSEHHQQDGRLSHRTYNEDLGFWQLTSLNPEDSLDNNR